MYKRLELWHFIATRLKNGEAVMLLVVADSSGSSPGRAGYKMAITESGELYGSIGGGVMEVNLVNQAKALLSGPEATATGPGNAYIKEQIHQKNSPNASGMICSGRQTVIFQMLAPEHLPAIDQIISAVENRQPVRLSITPAKFAAEPTDDGSPGNEPLFEKSSETDFNYIETIGVRDRLFIIGGGHCALALSELMSKMGFEMSIFDDRPDLNTIDKNEFADEIVIVDSYETIGGHIPSDPRSYVVVMTLGYKFDEIVIRALFDKDFKYFGVLGSRAKMATLIKALENDGFARERLARIRTPIGIPINSRTPEEIAVSIAAEVISVRNS